MHTFLALIMCAPILGYTMVGYNDGVGREDLQQSDPDLFALLEAHRRECGNSESGAFSRTSPGCDISCTKCRQVVWKAP